MRPRRRKQESGFALLLVFALAAALAISLYMQLPRAAFEAQRNKEELLIERGEQYKRAVQLFYTKNKRFPQSMDELEKMGDIRFLRKRYKDPITGEDEWRVVHTNGTMLTDSVIKKKEEKKESTNTFVTEGPSIGASNGPEANGVNLALRRRESDQNPLPGPNAPGQVPVDPNAPPPFVPAGVQPGAPVYPNNAATPAERGIQPIGGPQGQGSATPGQAGPNGATPQNAAVDIINNILRTPRAGPNAPVQVATPQACPSGNCVAGVASKAEMPSIKLYKERQKYNEWEFVYEIMADKRVQAAMGLQPGAQPPGTPGAAPNPIQPGFPSAFGGAQVGTGSAGGSTRGFGGGSGFGQPPGQTGGFGQQPSQQPGQGTSAGGSGGFISAAPSIGSAPPPPAPAPGQGTNPNPGTTPNPQQPQLPGFPTFPPQPQPRPNQQ